MLGHPSLTKVSIILLAMIGFVAMLGTGISNKIGILKSQTTNSQRPAGLTVSLATASTITMGLNVDRLCIIFAKAVGAPATR